MQLGNSLFSGQQRAPAISGTSQTTPLTTGLFSGTSSNNTSSLFSNTGATYPTSSLFSTQKNDTAANKPSEGLFGNLSASSGQKPNNPLSTNSLFNTTQNQPRPTNNSVGTNLFGLGSTTNNSSLSGLFSQDKKNETQPASSLFNLGGTTAPATAGTTPSLFGGSSLLPLSGTPKPQESSGGLFGSSSANTLAKPSLFGMSNVLGSQQPTSSTSAFGGAGSGLQPQWSPFGLPTSLGVAQPAEMQRDVVRQQMLACGIDIDSLPLPLQMVLPKICNPNTRTLQFLVKLMSRVVTLQEIREKNEDLSCFVFSKAPSADVAIRLQALCDQQAAAAGPAILQKLNKAKETAPEPKSQFFAEYLLGFAGLQNRVKDQASFFQNFAATLKSLQLTQKKFHDAFEEKAIEKLHRIRRRQAELRHRVINLVGILDDLAVRAQGFEGDDQEVAHIEGEYERLKRYLLTYPDSLQRNVPLIRQKFQQLEAVNSGRSDWKPSSPAVDERKSIVPSPLQSSATVLRQSDLAIDYRSVQEELMSIALRHHKELELLRKKMSTLAADVQDLMESIVTPV